MTVNEHSANIHSVQSYHSAKAASNLTAIDNTILSEVLLGLGLILIVLLIVIIG